MAVHRSPTKASITYDDSNNSIASRCESQSQPDLSRWVQYRKRKHPDDDLADRFDLFEDKIMSLLSKMAETQAENLETISRQVTLITD